jgi:hypothetical protein
MKEPEQPKYQFEGVCSNGHKVVGAFSRDDVKKSLTPAEGLLGVSDDRTKLDLFCGCGERVPLTSHQIDVAKREFRIK